MRIAIAQLNFTVGAFDAIHEKVREAVQRARQERADLVIFSELATIGGPCGDLVERPDVQRASEALVREIAQLSDKHLSILIGFAEPNHAPVGPRAWNAAALCTGGKVFNIYRQSIATPFDLQGTSHRNFAQSPPQQPLIVDRTAVALSIGNDLWNAANHLGQPLAPVAPALDTATRGARVVIQLDADPWYWGRPEERLAALAHAATTQGRFVVFANQVGAHNEVVYDGRSMVIAPNGDVVAQGAAFKEDLVFYDIPNAAVGEKSLRSPHSGKPAASHFAHLHEEDETLQALILGVRDNVTKAGFKHVALGLSGGIDSALVAAIAVEALGAENVHGVAMPSQHSSDHSIADAKKLAENLGVHFQIIPIRGIYDAVTSTLADAFQGTKEDVTEENIQSRARGLIMMSLSNKFGYYVLTTGNKSEAAVGYSTLYGDMCGSLAVILDVPKLLVYRLSRHYNALKGYDAIPENTIVKPPSAELRPDQTDQDSLPPYDILDAIVERYVVQLKSAQEIIADGYQEADVRRVIHLVNLSEYKRGQAAPGIRITRRAFGSGRVYPHVKDLRGLFSR